MRLPDTLVSRFSRLPLGTLAVVGIAFVLVWAYGRYHQKPVPSPQRQAGDFG